MQNSPPAQAINSEGYPVAMDRKNRATRTTYRHSAIKHLKNAEALPGIMIDL
jgi:hypothetical protein